MQLSCSCPSAAERMLYSRNLTKYGDLLTFDCNSMRAFVNYLLLIHELWENNVGHKVYTWKVVSYYGNYWWITSMCENLTYIINLLLKTKKVLLLLNSQPINLLKIPDFWKLMFNSCSCLIYRVYDHCAWRRQVDEVRGGWLMTGNGVQTGNRSAATNWIPVRPDNFSL